MILPINAAEVLQNDFNYPVVYIAGRVTGLPYDEVYAKFRAKQLELEADQFFVLNPCEHIAADCDWEEAMRTAIMLLVNADFICLLPDWSESEGAKLERSLALKLGIHSIDQ